VFLANQKKKKNSKEKWQILSDINVISLSITFRSVAKTKKKNLFKICKFYKL
jgi:hypothetical protein